MSGKKPPPRPPLPKRQLQSKNAKTVNSPGRLRSALASISIRYNPTTAATRDLDSDEEICIVRKEEKNLGNQKGDDDSVSDEIDENTRVTEENDCERSKQSTVITANSCQPLLELRTESLNGADQGLENNEKRTIVKQKTWPGNSKISLKNSGATEMRLIRRDQGASKIEPSKINDNNDEADSGSQPSKTHLNLSTDKGSNVQREGNRPRSPSPFRRLYRQQNNEHVGEKLAATSSSISLSSLLAAAATDDHNVESEKENEEVEEFQDAVPELSGSDVMHFEEVDNPKRRSPVPSSGTKINHEPSFTFLLFCVLLFYVYFISSLPVFVNGMIVGSVISYLVGCLILIVVCPEDSIDERFQRELNEYNLRVSLAPKPTYISKDPGLLLRPRGMKGWMLKAYEYDPNSISETTLIYARLKDNTLTLSQPKSDGSSRKIDIKTVDENTNLQFVHHEHFNITGSKITLTPPTLSPRRIWSKKYPLCLVLGNSTEQQVVDNLPEEEQPLQEVKNQVNVLYLFAKTGRQKEEWFQHFDRILKPKKNDLVSDIDHLLWPSSCSYPHYMAKLLPNTDLDMQDSQEVQLSWVNMLFGRVFWDVWQDRYWADKIKQRFQNKLSKVHKPQFIRDIHITDLSLGHTFPVINKVSPPVLDEQGTWVDFDVTYSGGVVFTVETHLNIDGYLKHFLNLGKENKQMTGDLDMAELTRKYEMLEKEENLLDLNHPIRDVGNDDDNDDDDSLTSESPPESDSDFESPESELEELISKQNGSRPTSSGSESTEVTSASEGSSYAQEALLQLKSLEGFLEKQIAEDEEMNLMDVAGDSTSPSISQESLPNAESFANTGRSSPVQKQSSSEDSLEKACLSPPLTPKLKITESPLASPAKQKPCQPAGTRRKLIGVLERLAKSKWVKKAAETKIVKTAAEKFSNLPIILSVEVQSVKGTLTLNIPPPPTNRLWYGFRGNPMLFVTARPKLGARQVKLTHVTDWIERKLKQEFKNMFVLPNMEDIPIKIMNSEIEKQFSDN